MRRLSIGLAILVGVGLLVHFVQKLLEYPLFATLYDLGLSQAPASGGGVAAQLEDIQRQLRQEQVDQATRLMEALYLEHPDLAPVQIEPEAYVELRWQF